MRRLTGVAVLCLAAGLAARCAAETAPPERSPADAADFLAAKAEDLQRWREARFGLFIHWGPVSLKGTEIGWSRGGERRGTGGTGEIPLEVYDNLYKEFNPTKFDAREWVAIAKAAGMKYLVFTTKHHDGFVMFDSKLTDYKITRSPFKRDIVAELAGACHAGGLALGFYYSPPDWHHPDYRTENHARYIEYLHGQLGELCTNYGKVDVIWFDGLGGSAKDWDSENLFKMIRSLQPHVVIDNRAGLRGDFDTPEQAIGRFQTARPWESCITIGQQWAWKPGDRIKSLKECVRTLVKCAGGDGNLLLNVGPMPTGEIEPQQVERLKEIGRWLERCGESIYGTRGGPVPPQSWGCTTWKRNTIYVHILDWPTDTLRLPAMGKKIVSSSVLSGGKAEVRQTDEGIEISVAPADRQEIDTVVALVLDGPAAEAAVQPSASVAMGKSAAASNVFQKDVAGYGPDKAFDGNPETRWATDGGTHAAWLEVDLGAPVTVNRAMIREAFAGRAKEYELQAKRDGQWQTFARGTEIGEDRLLTFGPITAQVIRLNILNATEGPTISEFQLFAAKK